MLAQIRPSPTVAPGTPPPYKRTFSGTGIFFASCRCCFFMLKCQEDHGGVASSFFAAATFSIPLKMFSSLAEFLLPFSGFDIRGVGHAKK